MPVPPGARDRSLVARLTTASTSHPWLFLAGALLVAAVCVKLASGLEIRSSFEELLPEDVPSVAHIKQLVKRVGGDGSILIVIESLDGPKGLPAAKQLAPRLGGELLAMGRDQIRAVQYSMAPIQAWYSDHWPLFAELSDLTEARDALRKEIKRRKLEANPLLVDLEDGEAAAPTSAPAAAQSEWLDPKEPLPRERVAERFKRFDEGFLVDPATRSRLTLNVRPAGTSLGVVEARALVSRIEALVETHRAELDAAHLRVGYGGSTLLFLSEYESITNDVFGTAGLCFSLVIASIFLFFRDLRSTASLGAALLVAIAVTFGLTELAIGYLNTQTAFLGVIVAGNGVNYGLVYLACVQQLRQKGIGLREACIEAAHVTSQSTLLASATTAIAFGVLVVAANRGFRHFGFIGGVGMLLCWFATFALVPSFLTLYEKVRPFSLRGEPAPHEHAVPGVIRAFFARPAAILVAFGVLTLASGVLFVRYLPTAMERNLDNLGNDPPKGQDQLRRDNDAGQNSLGKSIAGTLALLDSREEADLFCDAMRERMKLPSTTPGAPPNSELIDGCETVSAVVPRFQKEKLALIGELRAELTDALLDKLPAAEAARLRAVRADLAAQRPLGYDDAPPALLDPFRERGGTVGRLAVVTARPLAHTELAPNLKAFVKAMRGVPVNGRLVDSAGGNVVFSDLLENIDVEGPRASLLSFVGVFLLVLLYFRNWRTSSEVIVSLVVGVLFMGGLAAAGGIKLNFFNFIIFPVTFGIAVDYGANVAARVHVRKGAVLSSLVEVGPAVILCSWTTLIGYGSLLLSVNRALRSFGWYGMIGEVTTLLTALVLLPALMLVRERRGGAAVGA